MIPYSRPKLYDLYTLSQSKLLENHTFHSGTYLYGPYMAVSPPGARGICASHSFVSWLKERGKLVPRFSLEDPRNEVKNQVHVQC